MEQDVIVVEYRRRFGKGTTVFPLAEHSPEEVEAYEQALREGGVFIRSYFDQMEVL